MARHKFQPTKEQRELVKALTGFGIPQDQICMLVENSDTGKPISEPTLRSAFRKEIDTGKATADAQVARNLHKLACGSGSGAVSAAIWWTKTRMGWKETQKIEHSGPDGGAIQQESVTKEQVAEVIESARDKF